MQEQFITVIKGSEVDEYLQSKGRWLLANIDQTIGWPEEKLIILFRGTKVALIPSTQEYYPAVAVLCRLSAHSNESKKLILHFLSSLCWCRPGKLHNVRWTSSSSMGQFNDFLRLKKGDTYMQMQACHFKPTYLPDPPDKKARLALAFYREGMSLENTAYAFLSFYKIVNLHNPKPDKQRQWLKRQIAELEKNKDLKDRINEIRADGNDPGEYLYKSCRCAVAHADINDITYDPENIDDEIRLYKDIPLIRQLAKLIIEKHFSVKSLHAVFQEHLYETAGFYPLLGKATIDKLKREAIPGRSIKLSNKFSLRIYGVKKLEAFENLTPRILSAVDGKIKFELHDDEHLILILIEIDFINNRLIFDLSNIKLSDNGTQKSANFIADFVVFQGKLFANGELEIWNATDNKILGRRDQFIPVNMFYAGDKALFAEEAKWREIAKSRSIDNNH